MGKDYTKEEDDILREFRKTKYISEIYDIFKTRGFERSVDSIEHRCRRLSLVFEGPEKKEGAEENSEKDTDILNEAWGRLTRLSQDYVVTDGQTLAGLVVDPARKILFISDLHIPFQRSSLVLATLLEHQDADILVVGGDLLELYSVSTFPKRKDVPLLKEYGIALEWVRVFAGMFKQVILLRGNHEHRLQRYWEQTDKSKSVAPFIKTDILTALANGEEYDEEGKLVKRSPFPNVSYNPDSSWYVTIGKTLFAHPNFYLGDTSQASMRTVVKFDQEYRTRLDYDCVVMGHVHKMGKIIRNGRLLIESGCLCGMLEYMNNADGAYTIQVAGFTVVYQDKDGNTDFINSSPIYRGCIFPRPHRLYSEAKKKLPWEVIDNAGSFKRTSEEDSCKTKCSRASSKDKGASSCSSHAN